jgi:putative endonuclease
MAAKDLLGRAGEERAARYLTALGYVLLDRNWRCDQGEIDIVAMRDAHLCVIEVKTRRSDAFGHPFEAVDERKRRRLWKLGYAWREAHPDQARGLVLRLEVIGITGPNPASAVIEHLEDIA